MINNGTGTSSGDNLTGESGEGNGEAGEGNSNNDG